ncbi:MAG TPA: SUKH-3 domain-containing protein [Pirellulaceae bacterium]|nr:SUKH-3 domain-containing protein [Pirellulaceae bacterium]
MFELPDSIRPTFIAAGWYPGRRVGVSSAVPPDHPAADIIATFGGLTVARLKGSMGEECGLDDLAFHELAPDPSVLNIWADLLGTTLVGVAEIHYGHGEWYVALDGRVFGCSRIHDAFWFAGSSFAEAAERSLFGMRVRPLLRPHQRSVTLYGVEFVADSPEVYQYR